MEFRDMELDRKAFIAQELSDQGDAAIYELKSMGTVREALAKKIEQNEHLLEQAEQDVVMAIKRRDEFAGHLPKHVAIEPVLDVIRKEIIVQEKLIAELRVERELLVLKSPFDGMVSKIARHIGETVLPGEAVVTIREANPSEIVAYVTEEQVSSIKVGMSVELFKMGRFPKTASSKIKFVCPTLKLLPKRLWNNLNVPQWGRPVLIAVNPDLKLLPDELVRIKGL